MVRLRTALAFGLIGVIAQPADAAPATYPLGSAAHCKANYREQILTTKTKGRAVKYVACVYVPPKTTAKPKVSRADDAAKATVTRLTVSQVNLVPPKGQSSIVQDWKATVSGVGGNPAPTVAPGELTFVLTDGGTVITSFAGTTAPTECSITLTGGPSFGTIMQSTPPYICGGGMAGYVTLTFEQGESHQINIRAVYAGAPGWAPSSSGTVPPLDVSPSAPWSA